MNGVIDKPDNIIAKDSVIGNPDCDITVEEALEKYEHMIYELVQNRPQTAVCTYDDLVQEGRMAIVEAYNSYNPQYGTKLGTWTWRRISNALSEFQKKNLMCVSGGASRYQKIKNLEASETDAIDQRLRESFNTKNLDELSQVIGADDVEKNEFSDFNWRSYLNDEEIFVVEHHFGFNGESPLSLKDIGILMGGKSRKAVDYILDKAIVKLQCIPHIEDYWYV